MVHSKASMRWALRTLESSRVPCSWVTESHSQVRLELPTPSKAEDVAEGNRHGLAPMPFTSCFTEESTGVGLTACPMLDPFLVSAWSHAENELSP